MSRYELDDEIWPPLLPKEGVEQFLSLAGTFVERFGQDLDDISKVVERHGGVASYKMAVHAEPESGRKSSYFEAKLSKLPNPEGYEGSLVNPLFLQVTIDTNAVTKDRYQGHIKGVFEPTSHTPQSDGLETKVA